MKYLFLLSFLLVAPVKKHKLTLKLKVGEIYTHTYTNKVYSIVNSPDPSLDYSDGFTIDMTGGRNLRVIDSKEGIYYIKCSYTKTTMDWKLDSMGDEEEMDEFLSMMRIMNDIIAKLEGKEFDIELFHSGKIKEIRGLEEIIRNLETADIELSMSEIMEMKDIILQQYGAESLRTNIELTTNIFPENKVRADDSWKKTHTSEVDRRLTYDTELTLTDITESYFQLEGKMDIYTNPTAEWTEYDSYKTKSAYKGNGTISLKIDPETGWVQNYVSELKVKGETEIEYSYSADETETKKMYMSMTQSIEIEN